MVTGRTFPFFNDLTIPGLHIVHQECHLSTSGYILDMDMRAYEHTGQTVPAQIRDNFDIRHGGTPVSGVLHCRSWFQPTPPDVDLFQ